jgi:flavodoxin
MGNTKEGEPMPIPETKKVLVAYYSYGGSTRQIANHIHDMAGGDILEIQPVTPYPNDYDAVVKQAKEELASGHKPELKTKIDNLSSYDMVFVGFPNWCNTFPAPVRTFLSQHDFSGKTIVPFCTHGGTGLGRSVTDISTLCPRSKLLDGTAILARDVKASQEKVSEWLQRIKITK